LRVENWDGETPLTNESPNAAYPWPFFAAVAATGLLFFSFHGLFSVLPLYIIDLGGASVDTGIATWVFALAALLVRPPAGLLADRWGRKPALVLGALLFGGAPLLYGLVTNVSGLLLVRAIHGMGLALFSTSYQAFVADWLPVARYGEGFGIANAASTVTMTVAPLFGEVLESRAGWQSLFIVLGGIGAAGLAITLTLPRRKYQNGKGDRDDAATTGSGLRRLLDRRVVRLGALGMMVLGVPFGAFITFLPLLAEARAIAGTGWAFMGYALASSLAQPAMGRAIDRWGARRTVLVGITLISLSAVGLAYAANVTMLLTLAVLFGVGHGAARVSFDTRVQRNVDTDSRGSASAILYTAFDLMVGLGSWGLGALAGAMGYRVMYGAVAAIVLVGLAIGAMMGVKRKA